MLNNPVFNETEYQRTKHLMPKQCPKPDCMFVYNPRLCYNCSQLEHNKQTSLVTGFVE